MLKLLSLIVTLVVLALGISLGVLNATPVELNLFLIKPTLPLSLVLTLFFIAGFLLGALIISMQIIRIKWHLRKQIKLNQKQADEIIQLKKFNLESQAELKKPANSMINLK
ncbi:LapA family protein [Thiomicrorhabdus aquaedulcis]|uniref:LapA family protein n=1 Tax=Thiomicrorhabdus aquaedulcis TaxID=2211106 RepID=UPI000FD80593|nr:LapA family protein [Thiomicrorhabdus aquaedulcis]